MSENSRLRVANSGPRAFAPDFATNAAIGRWLRCVANPDPTKPIDVQWQDLVVPALVNLSTDVYIDSGTTVPPAGQTGNIEASHGTLLGGFAAAPANSTLLLTSRDYQPEGGLIVDKNIAVQGIGQSLTPFRPTIEAPHVNAGTVLSLQNVRVASPFGAVGGTPVLGTDGTSVVYLDSCDVAGVSLGTMHARNCNLVFTFPGGFAFQGGDVIDCNLINPPPLTINDVTFTMMRTSITGIAPSFAFAAPGGQLFLDQYTYGQFLNAGCTLANGRVVILDTNLRARISVIVPAIVAVGVDYANASTVGTPLEGIPADTPIMAHPTADLAAAGANNGGFLNARVSAASTIRLAFTGILLGGAVDFIFQQGGPQVP